MASRRPSSAVPALLAVVFLVWSLRAAPALAQQTPPAPAAPAAPTVLQPTPIGPFAVDVRVALPRFDQNGFTAGELGVVKTTLPTWGIGAQLGAHWYPLHVGGVTVGVGGSMLVGRARRTPTDANGKATGPAIETRLIAFSPQVSLNFGTGAGWSYISGGIGRSVFDTRLETTPADNSRKAKTIDFGGGARWFAKPHLAFSLDLRFYSIPEQAATATLTATPKTTRMVFSVGISIK
jgi:hypothetical protein